MTSDVELQAAIDAADLATAAAVEALGEPGIPHEQVMAAFDALDAAEQVNSAEEVAEILGPHAALLGIDLRLFLSVLMES